MGNSRLNHGKKSWEIHGKITGKSWEIREKITGNIKSWEKIIHGKIAENLRENHGKNKIMENSQVILGKIMGKPKSWEIGGKIFSWEVIHE